jgi:gliding motility-associated-like protein
MGPPGVIARSLAFIIFVLKRPPGASSLENPCHPMRKNYLIVISILLAAGAHAQSMINGLYAPLAPSAANVNGEREKLSDPATWTEQADARTLYTSTYHTPEGQVVTSSSSRPINYFKDGRLVPIDAKLKLCAEGYAAKDQPNPTYFLRDMSAAVSIGEGHLLNFGLSPLINGNAPEYFPFEVSDNEVLIKNITPGIDKQFLYYENAVKYNYILHNPVLSSDGFFRFREEVRFPEGYELVYNREHGHPDGTGWCGDLQLLDGNGTVQSSILAPICYDANKQYTIATYFITSENGRCELEMRLPVSWINDASRSFPVVVDPVVIGPTATWTGGYQPSCLIPSYNVDSLQVTVPAGITVTGLFVTSSYYADPFTTAVMSQGNMYFSTVCSVSQNFTVPNPTGNTPGTAYLDSFDLHAPLLCCFPQTCSQYTFWLRMHLGRSGPSTGCNTTYIRYDPFTTLWPFKALIVGRTVETFGNMWQVPNTPICSNNCSITGKIYVRDGVPPYTLSHPWGTTTVQGSAQGCSNGAVQYTFNLTIPNCPVYCTSATSITVPPPIVVDACGDTLTGLPSRTVPLKSAPDITATPTTGIFCSNDPFSITLGSCIGNDTTHWFGNSLSGTGNISDQVVNSGTSATTFNYSAYATSQGCYSDTIQVPVTIDPLPSAAFTWSPNPAIVNIPITFTDISTIYAGQTNSWFWNFGSNNTSVQQTPVFTFGTPGTYQVCLEVTTDHGCIDTLCQDITVIPAEVVPPNVVTPNGDGQNDLLKFEYLEFYPGNSLEIYDRWGAIVYEKSGYANDWNPSKLSDGTYYYVLKVTDMNKNYTGFIEVLR